MTRLTWLVTGCSSGFGEALVLEILARGDRVVATARNASERLKNLEKLGAAVLELDVTASQNELDSKVKCAMEVFDGIDVLVNNAGYFELGLIEEISHERWIAQLSTNLFGPMNMTRAVIPYFRRKKKCKLVFVGSVNGWSGTTASAAYTTSKFALEGYVDCLQKELSSSGIESIIFEPGGFRTKLLSSSKLQSDATAHDEYKEFFEVVQNAIESRNGKQSGDVKKAAQRMVDVVKSEGMAAGRSMPKRLPLGSESSRLIKEKCFETLRICNEWDEVISSTDIGKVVGRRRAQTPSDESGED